MNASQTIQAAIETLERLRDSSTRGPWTAAAGFDANDNLEYSLIAQEGFDFFDVLDAVNEDVHKASADADLVEILHRTIGAQLTILREGLEVSESISQMGFGSTLGRNALAFNLARAIQGGGMSGSN